MQDVPEPRKVMPDPKLTEAEFKKRFIAQFIDTAFGPLQGELASLAHAAWQGYAAGRKSPRTQPAGAGFADPSYHLADDWRRARDAVLTAQTRRDDASAPAHYLLINCSSRSEHTCPGESSKSFRLLEMAHEVIAAHPHTVVEVLDLSRVASEYGRKIHPCKCCFSTSAALCHWPCSCYPNYSLGQTQDWMNDIYPMWIAAHGVFIISPVNWFHGSSVLKLMMDRMVCADGGNPDPTTTHGKDAKRAKQLELSGWAYPRPLEGRLFACVVHGDAEGAEAARRALCDWLSSLHMSPAGMNATLDRYIGYWRPYALNHRELDADEAIKAEVRNAAAALVEGVTALRAGRLTLVGRDLTMPRDK